MRALCDASSPLVPVPQYSHFPHSLPHPAARSFIDKKNEPNQMKLMLKPILSAAAIAALSAIALTSCNTDDDLRPCPYDKFYAEALQGSEAELYEAAYATLRTTDTHIHHTPTTHAGCNIRGTDGTMSDFVRSLFNIEELASDECILRKRGEAEHRCHYDSYETTHSSG